MAGRVLASLEQASERMTTYSSTALQAGALLPGTLLAMLALLVGCQDDYDCYRLRRETPTIELVDRIGDPGIPFYDISLVHVGRSFEGLPRCPGFDFVNVDAQISLTDVEVGQVGRQCALMTATARAGDASVPFGLAIDGNTLFDASVLGTGQGEIILGAPEARFGTCTGYWLTVLSPYVDGLYDDPGEGAFPPWVVYRLFRPNGDAGCPIMEPCVDGFSARMVMTP